MAKKTVAKTGPISLCQVLEEEYENLHGSLPSDYNRNETDEQKRLAALFKLIHKQNRSAFCISGGGIRSGTFALGIMQGLARCGLLGRFDYLSTVSGGGYIGSWLTSWIHRDPEGEQGVVNALKHAPIAKIQVEPETVRHLRSYSNYLSPKLGLLSADTWTLAAIYVRNLILNWLVLIPLIAAVLMVPRIYAVIAGAVKSHALHTHSTLMTGLFIIGGLLGVLAISYIGLNRPSVNARNKDLESSEVKSRSQGAYLWLCWLPLLISAFLLTIYWAWYVTIHKQGLGLVYFLGFGIALNLLGFILWAVLSHSLLKNKVREFIMVIIGGAVGGCLMYLAATASFFFSETYEIQLATYVTLAVPVLLAVFVLSAILFNGLISFWTTDSDREWWSRSDAWILIAIVGWAIISAIVIFGPIGLGRIEAYAASVGGLSGLVTVLLGRSPDTASDEKQKDKEEASWPVWLKNIALKVAAPIFAIFLIILIALAVTAVIKLIDGSALADWLSKTFSLALHLNLKDDPLPADLHDQYNHLGVIYRTPFWLVIGLTVVALVISCGMALFVNINRFSLHSMYRNRLIRAYLGASNVNRKPNKFTGFDPNDNIRMHKLWPETDAQQPRTKLFHVINMALNLVHGKNLAWQERKAESFTATPLHSGNYSVGYRSSKYYGGPGGISLGTAVAISGAAASPNMGYNSSTFITFLMTLFNARLGWWLGNPGAAGKDTYYLDGPYFALKPLIAETLGLTDDESNYVYLSDGGHFENLGLYEMVLRRCHFIVVSDGSQDNEVTFSSLGNAVRKIRIDLGVPIDFNDPMCIFSRNPERKGKYCAIGKIRYSCVDGPNTDGILIYIKPAFYGDEPRDVYEYAKANEMFPHESTADQFFTESQFESYRMLGSYIMEQLCPEGCDSEKLSDFLNTCIKHLYPDPTPTTEGSNTPSWLSEWISAQGEQASK